MYIVWALLGAFLAWLVLGALIGTVAALGKGFPAVIGIFGGCALGPLAFLMFYWSADATSDRLDPKRTIVYDTRLSRFARRRCPECTGPNESLIWQGAAGRDAGDGVGDFVPSYRLVFTHRYECIACGYEWEFESPLEDPDKPPVRVY